MNSMLASLRVRGRSGPLRRIGRVLCVAWMGCAAFAWPPGYADPVETRPLEARLEALRELAGTNPNQARVQVAALREETARSGQLDLRLAVYEFECRLLTDIDISQAIRVAEAGISIGRQANEAAPRLSWLRLRSCHAAALLERGEEAAANRELEDVLGASTSASLAAAHALALMERGTGRSKKGDMLAGQQDLLKACDMLKAPDLHRDLVICLGSLANHHKRIGDLDEAMQLLTQLRATARSRAARFHESMYAYGMAEVHFLRGDWPQALAAFQEVADMARALHDPAGLAYAESGIGGTLGRMGQPAQGLPHVDTALRLLDEPADPGHALRNRVLRAKLLTASGRVQESDEDLRAVEAGVRALKQDWVLAQWLSARAQTSAAIARWSEAYQALDEWRVLDDRQQRQTLSEASTRLRLQFSRELDRAELQSLRRLNEQGEELRRMQSAVLALFVLLLLASVGFAAHKLLQSRALKSLASTDELTGMPNRRTILAYAEHQMNLASKKARRLSVLMVDIDHFKRINDTHGHTVGDEVLRHVGRVLPTALRAHDRLGRIGGEEFLVILPDATLDQAVIVANRIREAMAGAPFVQPEGDVRVTVSIGAAEWMPESERIEALLSRADLALYRAKSGGRDAVSAAVSNPGEAVP
jgi:diguanylate cyclase (GGDEF)-like protein